MPNVGLALTQKANKNVVLGVVQYIYIPWIFPRETDDNRVWRMVVL